MNRTVVACDSHYTRSNYHNNIYYRYNLWGIKIKINFGAMIKTLKFLFPDIIKFIIVVSAKLKNSGKLVGSS